jgi:hypothetical protein
MDKILLTAFLSALAGFITAVISIVKLVNEKEGKITDYRQTWTTSLRICMADLIAKMNTQAGNIAQSSQLVKQMNDLMKNEVKDSEENKHKRYVDFVEDRIKNSHDSIREMRKEIYQAYALVRLHFKPNDLSFSRVENKFDVIMNLFTEIHEKDDKMEVAAAKEKVHAATNEMTNYCRDILKIEWEHVKNGEPSYKKTRKWSVVGGVVMLFILISIGVHSVISIWKSNIVSADQSSSKEHYVNNPK